MLGACAGSAPKDSQDSSGSFLDRWEYALTPYVWAVQVDGDQTIDGVQAPVDVEFGDDLGYGLRFGAEKRPWSVLAEAMYLDAEGSAPNSQGMATTSGIEQVLLEADLSYQLGRDAPIEILGGLRYNWLDSSVAVMGGGNASGSEGWLDPILGARLVAHLSDAWTFLWRLDIGGFRIGSEFSWQSVAGLRYRASELLSFELDYRVLDIDYQTSSFVYDAQTGGVVLGAGFHW